MQDHKHIWAAEISGDTLAPIHPPAAGPSRTPQYTSPARSTVAFMLLHIIRYICRDQEWVPVYAPLEYAERQPGIHCPPISIESIKLCLHYYLKTIFDCPIPTNGQGVT